MSLLSNDVFASLLAFIIVLIPAVIIHEFGHFLAAKAVGITVLEFGIGFPPRLVKLFNWGETEFTLNVLPLGGFVRPLGEDMIRPLSEAETQQERERVLEKLKNAPSTTDRDTESTLPYLSEREELAARGMVNVKSINEAKPIPRIIFMAAGAFANFLSAFMLFVLVGLLGIPQPAGAAVGLVEIGQNSMLTQAGLLPRDIVERGDGQKLISSRELFRLFEVKAAANQPVTLTVYRDEAAQPLTITFTPNLEESQALVRADGGLYIQSLQPGSPAESAGLLPDDQIIAFNGQDLRQEEEPFFTLQRLSRENQGLASQITVLRNGDELILNITPRIDPPEGQGRLGTVFAGRDFYSEVYGVRYVTLVTEDYVPLGFIESVQYGWERMIAISRSIVEFPLRLLRQETAPEENRIISLVGVSQLGGEFLQQSIEQNRPTVILNYIALISIALGITNLFPIPALDGGRILFVLVEIVRGKPIAPEREGIIHLIGLAFLLSIGIIFILNDILNPATNLLP